MSELKNLFKSVSWIEALLLVVAIVVFIVLFCCAFGWVTMLLWNWLMPTIFGLTTITFWQAVGLMILGSFIFGGSKITINKTINEVPNSDK